VTNAGKLISHLYPHLAEAKSGALESKSAGKATVHASLFQFCLSRINVKIRFRVHAKHSVVLHHFRRHGE
jgi:hypothetical protein